MATSDARGDAVLALDPGSDPTIDAAGLRLIAHDVNNPLTAIRILAEMLLADVPAEHAQDVADILEAADLASAVVARLGEGEDPARRASWIPLDLVEALHQVVARPALRAHVCFELPDELWVRGEPGAILGALSDVLFNARGLVAQGRQVVVRGQVVDSDVRLVVVHGGALPIPATMRNHLFHRRGVVALRDRRIPVSAIGLVDAYATVVAHGGTMSVEDADEDGILVVMTLPI